ncbi:MAG TPA: hypothetical protein VGZ29_03270 [Terriglobia bacterium]|nr:hypothetical protein [Terriglobia bacterium]
MARGSRGMGRSSGRGRDGESHRKPWPVGSRNRGYTLLLLMVTVTVLLVWLTALAPDILTQGQREREEELVFRGNQYARAIYLFHNQFGRYPFTVQELIETNNIRFLRKEFKDPMTRGGDWRFIYISPAGVLADSTMMGRPGSNSPGQAALGSAAISPSVPQFGQAPISSTLFVPSQYASAQFGFGGQPALFRPSQASQSQSGDADAESSPADPQSDEPGSPETAAGGQDPAGGQGEAEDGSSSQSDDGSRKTFGGFIAGVASTSRHASIRIWNGKQHYNEWEFFGVVAGAWMMPGMSTGAPQGGAPGSPNPFQTASPAP